MKQSSRTFRLLLRLCPPSFRNRYGDEMEEIFVLNLTEAQGSWRRSRVWARAILDLVARSLRLRMEASIRTRRSNSPWRNGVIAEFRPGLRRLARQRWQSLLSVLIVAVGIASATAIFALLQGVVLEPLSYRQPDRLVRILQLHRGTRLASPYMRAYQAVIADAVTLEKSVVLQLQYRILLDGPSAERISIHHFSGDFFSLLGIAPLIGQLPNPDDEQSTVLSYAFWQGHFGGDPQVIGREIRLLEMASETRESHRIAAVMPLGFGAELIPSGTGPDLWAPRRLTPPQPGHYSALPVIARLAPHASPRAVGLELNQRIEALADLDEYVRGPLSAVPLREAVVGEHARLFWMLFTAVGCLLAVCGLNFGGLLVANLRLRSSEIAIRKALGAGIVRIFATLLAESLPLALVGAGLGVLLAHWVLPLAVSLSPHAVPRLQSVALSPQTILFSLLSALVLGILGAILALPWNSSFEALRDSGLGAVNSNRRTRLAGVLVSAEVAFAVVLVFSGALVTNSLVRLYSVDPAYRSEHILTFGFPQPVRVDERGLVGMQIGKREVLRRIQEIPGVEYAAVGAVPLKGWGSNTVSSEGSLEAPPVRTLLNDISPDYFKLLDIELLRGRYFDDRDHENAVAVAIVGESLADELWPQQDPIGKRLTLKQENPEWIMVVGLARDVRRLGLDKTPVPEMYLPYVQTESYSSDSFLVRVEGDRAAVSDAIRKAITAWNPQRIMADVNMLDDLLAASLAERRFVVWLLNAFSAISLLLAGAGLYSITASLVADRTREVGLRMALGAEMRDILRHFLTWGLRLTGCGLVVGLPVAWASSRLLQQWLFEAGSYETAPFLAAASVTLLVALAACFWPSWRAARLDPLTALRRT